MLVLVFILPLKIFVVTVSSAVVFAITFSLFEVCSVVDTSILAHSSDSFYVLRVWNCLFPLNLSDRNNIFPMFTYLILVWSQNKIFAHRSDGIFSWIVPHIWNPKISLGSESLYIIFIKYILLYHVTFHILEYNFLLKICDKYLKLFH